MLAVGLDMLLFLFLVGMAGLLKLLASKTGNTPGDSEDAEESPPPPTFTTTSIPRAPAETDADRMRKFLEALGQPPTARPPPPVKPRETPPEVYQEVPRKAEPKNWKGGLLNPLPPVKTVPPPLERPRRVTVPRPVRSPALSPEILAPTFVETPTFEVGDETPSPPPPLNERPIETYVIDTPIATVGQSKSELSILLRSRTGLRQAMILREVFGPPRSLQPFDLVGSA